MSRKVCVIVLQDGIAIKFYGEDVMYGIDDKSILQVSGFTSVKFGDGEEMPCIDGIFSFNNGCWDAVGKLFIE